MERRTVLHFLRSYLFLLICLLLILLPLYQGTISLFEERQMSLTQEMLGNGLNRLNQQIDSLRSIALSIGQEAEYRAIAQREWDAMAPADYYRLNQLYTNFHRLCLSQPYVTDYGLLMRNQIIFTGQRMYFPSQAYYDDFISFGELDQAQFLKAFGHPRQQNCFLPEMRVTHWRENAKDQYQGMIWLCSMSQIASQNPIGVFFATFSEDTIRTLLMEGFRMEEAGIILSERNGEELFRSGWTKEENGRSLKVFATAGGLEALLYLSETLFVDMMKPIRNLLLIGFLILLLIGLVMCAFLAVRASLPIRRLVTQIKNTKQETADLGSAKNSFELIGNAFSSLESSLHEYKNELYLQQLSIRDHAFEALLQETPVRDGSFSQRHLQDFSHCFPNFPKRYRLALIEIVEDQENSYDLELLLQWQMALRRLVETQLTPVPYIFTSQRRFILTLDCDVPNHWRDTLAALRVSAQKTFQISLLIALSGEGTSCEMLHILYQEVNSILTLAMEERDSDLMDVWERSHFPDKPHEMPFDYTEMAQMYAMLLRGEKAGVLVFLRDIRSRMLSSSLLDEVMNRQIYYNIRGILLRVKMERYEALYSLDIPDHHGEMSLEALFDQIEACCAEMCDLIRPSLGNDKRSTFGASICNYIDEHLSDSMLSIRMVIDNFCISESTLQKAMRQEKNCSFFDYVKERRYAMAVDMLLNTDMPINQIAEACGFNSVNSFYKAFRRKSNVSPAALRQRTTGSES